MRYRQQHTQNLFIAKVEESLKKKFEKSQKLLEERTKQLLEKSQINLDRSCKHARSYEVCQKKHQERSDRFDQYYDNRIQKLFSKKSQEEDLNKLARQASFTYKMDLENQEKLLKEYSNLSEKQLIS